MKRNIDRDLTMYSKPAGPGIGFSRICAKCNKKRNALGGRTDKRTRMWRCADCSPPAAST